MSEEHDGRHANNISESFDKNSKRSEGGDKAGHKSFNRSGGRDVSEHRRDQRPNDQHSGRSGSGESRSSSARPERSSAVGDNSNRDTRDGYERKRRSGPEHSGRSFDRKSDDRGRSPRPDSERSGKPRSFDGDDRPERPRGATGALIELDNDLMKLLVRRATLVSRIRGGKDHAASPEAIQSEKAVRVAFENAARSFSKDPRFTRQLFMLLQDLKVLKKDQSDTYLGYNLSPSRKPVSGSIPGPVSTRAAQMRIGLAVFLGRELRLKQPLPSQALLDTIRAFSHCGSGIEHDDLQSPDAMVHILPGKPANLVDTTVFAGDDHFTLYLLVFLCLAQCGSCRINGGGVLKSADLSTLRSTLPLFGARLANVIPQSLGLPVTLEFSGNIPDSVKVPSDLPFEALCALLIAPLIWQKNITIDLADVPAEVATEALAEVGSIHGDWAAETESKGSRIKFSASDIFFPSEVSLPLEPVLCAYLLGITAFAGGQLSLKGSWPKHSFEAEQAKSLLGAAGLNLNISETEISAEQAVLSSQAVQPWPEVSDALFPLSLALQTLSGQKSTQEAYTLSPKNKLYPLACEFLKNIGFVPAAENNTAEQYSSDSTQADEPVQFIQSQESFTPETWTSPDAFWSMAYALCAYKKPGLRLHNPALTAKIFPWFWNIYNSLPNPVVFQAIIPRIEEQHVDKPARRRIITD